MTRTGSLSRLFGHEGEPVVQIDPQDMVRRRLADGNLARIVSTRGALVAPVRGQGFGSPAVLVVGDVTKAAALADGGSACADPGPDQRVA